METSDTARIQLEGRRRDLRAELEQVDRQLSQLDTKVVVSNWVDVPSGPGGRGTVYHTGMVKRCRPYSSPAEITLYEALSMGLNPCGTCKPSSGG